MPYNLYEEFMPFKDGELHFSIFFNRDSYSWATGQRQKIGYTVICTPQHRTTNEDGFTICTFGAFTGFKDCILEADRQSKKRLLQAVELFKNKKPEYIEYMNNKYLTKKF